MKKIILMIIAILALFCTASLEARAQEDKLHDEGPMKKILKAVSPSVVKVVAENHKRYVATGIAIDANHVISNHKVLPRHYRHLYIQTHDGKKLRAKLKGQDRQSSVIVLEVGGDLLKPIKRTNKSKTGDWVALVGSFYGSFPAIYDGHISSASDENLMLDAPVAPGASGAAVVNKKGELVAMVRGRYAFSFGPDYTFVGPDSEVIVKSSRSGHKELCYALPTDKIMTITSDLKEFGRVKRGWLGVNLDNNTEIVAINNVFPDSPAAVAGLRKGDVLLEMKGDKIKTVKDVQKIVRKLKPHQKVKINVLRGKQNQTIIAVLGDADKRHINWTYETTKIHGLEGIPEIARSLPTQENYVFRVIGSRNLGIQTIALNSELAKAFKIREGKGLMVSKVLENTAAAKAGILPSDIIVKIDDKYIAKITDLRHALNELAENEPIKVMIYRKGSPKVMTVVPDKNKTFESIFDRVNNSLTEMRIQIDEQKKLNTWTTKPRDVSRTRRTRHNEYRFPRTPETERDRELKKYKDQLEQMKKDQEQMRKDMQRLMKKLEEKEKNKENNKNKETEKKKEKNK